MKPFKTVIKKSIGLLALFSCLTTSPAFASLIVCSATNTKISTTSSSYAMPADLDNFHLLNMEANIQNEENVDLSMADIFQFGDTDKTQIAQTVRDDAGNTYITGGFTGTIEFGSTSLFSSNGFDMYVAKLDAQNDVLWARMASGSSTIPSDFSLDGAVGLAVDDDGNVYVGGTFVKSLTFVSQSGDTLETISDGRNDQNLNFEMFVAKYSTNGTLEWVSGGNSGSTGSENSLVAGRNTVNSIILDEEGYPYVAGTVSGSNLFGEATDLVGKGDFFLASLDKDGSSPFWVSTSGTPEDDYAVSISVDTLGYLNVLGVIGTGEMELPNFNDTWVNDTGSNDTFVISYDVNGEWYFVNFIGGGDDAIGNDITTSQNGDFFVVGEFNNTVFFPGSDGGIELEVSRFKEGFIAKYDLQGDILWAQQFGKSPTSVDVNKVTTDEEGNVYVLGRFNDFVIFDADAETQITLKTETENDLFIAKYDMDGVFMWAKQIESSGSQSKDLTARGEEQPFITQPLDFSYSKSNGGEFMLIGDFDGTLNLDEVSLTAPVSARSSYVATYKLGETVSNEESLENVVSEFELIQNYPNPFNPSTTLGFNLTQASEVTVTVHNNLGQLISIAAKGRFSQGQHRISFDGSNLSSGTYFYTITSGTMVETKKMTLIK
jgi:hypothetical protein